MSIESNQSMNFTPKHNKTMDGEIGEEDLVFYISPSGKEVYSGGFVIHSNLMKGGMAAMMSPSLGSETDSVLGGNYVVPPFWYYAPPTQKMLGGATTEKRANQNLEEEDLDADFLEEDLHEKLLSFITSTPNRKKGTAKAPRKATNKITRKQRKHNSQ